MAITAFMDSEFQFNYLLSKEYSFLLVLTDLSTISLAAPKF